MDKKAILLISFGSLRKTSQRNCVEILLDKIKNSFPEYTVKSVFTSVYILKKLKEEGQKKFSLAETLDMLKSEGYNEVMIQPTLLTEGEEYREKIVKIASIYKNYFRSINIAKPILNDDDNFPLIKRALISQIGLINGDEEVVFMGHGSKNIHNPAYLALQEKLDASISYITIGVMDGDRPSFDDVLERLRLKGRRAVYLMPLLFTTGMHVRDDLIDGKDSWNQRLKAAGFSVRIHAQGLGENEVFQDIFINSIKRYSKVML